MMPSSKLPGYSRVFDRLGSEPLVRFLRNQDIEGFTLDDWDQLIRLARRTNLLSRVAYSLNKADRLDKVPAVLRWHLDSALLIAESSRSSTLAEIRKVTEAMASADLPFILLKGAAYTALNLELSRSRLFSDIDILVKHADLNMAEQTLIRHGWLPSKLDRYDQKYYRLWMHELPPLQHTKRGTSIDVHHTLLPPTAKPTPDVASLWRDADPLPAYQGCHVLCPEDRILHSTTHLFHDGDFEQGLRDLVDLDDLIRAREQESGFWDKLIERAARHQLCRPLYYGLRYCRTLLGTRIPDEIIIDCQRRGGVRGYTVKAMDILIALAILPPLHTSRFPARTAANWLLYARSHYLRMPMHLLIPHLVRKSLRGEK